MLAISLIGLVNLNNSFEIKVSQLYNAVPWLVTYKIDDIFRSGIFLSFNSNQWIKTKLKQLKQNPESDKFNPGKF